MKNKRPRNLSWGVFKPINGLNPNVMKNIFSITLNARTRPNDILKVLSLPLLEIKPHNTRP